MVGRVTWHAYSCSCIACRDSQPQMWGIGVGLERGEGRGVVVHVWIHRLGELWVVAEALALEWEGGRRQGYGCACPNLVVAQVLVRMVGIRTKQWMAHINNSYLGLCLCPPSCVFCLAVMELGMGAGGGGEVMANRGAQWPLFQLMGWVGVGEGVNLREDREAECWHACNGEMERGMVCSCLVLWNHALRSEMVKVAKMRWFGGGKSCDMDENISPVENPIFAILTKNTSLQHYVQIAMIQRVFEHALFSRLKVQMHKDLKIGQMPWNWQQYVVFTGLVCWTKKKTETNWTQLQKTRPPVAVAQILKIFGCQLQCLSKNRQTEKNRSFIPWCVGPYSHTYLLNFRFLNRKKRSRIGWDMAKNIFICNSNVCPFCFCHISVKS